MAITKNTLIQTLTDAKVCMDTIYCKKEELGTIMVQVSQSEPDASSAHWIKPADSIGTLQSKKIVASTSQPSDSNAIWINTN